MNILILGGTGVISTEIVSRLHSLNHHVTVFNRGRRRVRYSADAEVIVGDKQDAEGFRRALKGRKF
ncbi:MAG: NAD-dependent epimerase/dehydratase family protein, partial [Treponema sp.]|nr:NAD-dependent epimerase/dehydratase family protein [Treponema sp.]